MRFPAIGLAFLALAQPVHAQRAHIGAHAGYYFDSDDALIGAQLLLPVTRSVELYPSFDYYLTSAGTTLGFNGDLKFRAPGPTLQVYFGGGVNVLRRSAGGASATDTGADLFGGFESRLGVTHPYVEVRAMFHNGSAVQLVGGLNITLY